MADETIKKLLIKLNISTSDWKVAINQIKTELNTVNAKAKADAIAQKQIQKDQLNLIKESISDEKRLAAEARTIGEMNRANLILEQKKQAAVKTTIQQKVLETVEEKKQQVIQQAAVRLAQEQVRLEQQKYRLAEQQRISHERTLKNQAREGGGVGGIFGKLANTLVGGGTLGLLVSGVVGGELLSHVFESGTEKLRDLVRELGIATGSASQLRAEFERLATGKGVNSNEFLERLRVSTRGLVNDFELFKVANSFLRSNVHASQEDIIKLTSNTVNLARAMGKDATVAVNSLQRAFTTGRFQAVAMATGIKRADVMLKGLPGTVTAATRSTLEFNKVLSESEKLLVKVGVPATTLPELFTQIGVAQKNFVEGIAAGILSTGIFGRTIGELSQKLAAYGPQLEEIAKIIGQKVAGALDWVVKHAHELKVALEVLLAVKIGSWLFSNTGGFALWGKAIELVTGKLYKLVAAEEAVAGAGAVEGVAGGLATAVSAPVLAAAGAGAAITGGGAYLAAKEQNLSLSQAKSGIIEWFTEVKEAISNAYKYISNLVSSIATTTVLGMKTAITYFLPEWSKGWDTIATVAESAWDKIKTSTASAYDFIIEHTPFGAVAKQLKELSTRADERKKKEDEFYGRTSTPYVAIPSLGTAGEPKEPPTAAFLKAMAVLKLKIEQEIAKEILETTKQRIAAEESELKDSYDLGLINLQEFTDKEKAIHEESYQARLTEIDQLRKAELQAFDEKRARDEKGNVVHDVQLDALFVKGQEEINRKFNQQELQAKGQRDSADRRSDKTLLNDKQAAYKTYTDAIAKIQNEGVQERTKLLEGEFKEGLISADDYIAQRKTLIEEETTIALKGLSERALAAKDNEKELATITVERINVAYEAEKKLLEFTVHADAIRLEALKTHYEKAKKFLETSLSVAQSSGSPEARRDELAITQQLYNMAESEKSRLINLQSTLNVSTDQERQIWIDTTEQIAQATQESNKMHLQLIEMRDTALPLSGIFGSIARVAGLTQTRTGSAIAETASRLQSSFEDFSKFNRGVGAAGGFGQLSRNLGQSVLGIFGRGHGVKHTETAKTAKEIFDAGLIKSTSIVDRSSEAMSSLTKEIERLIAILSAARDKIELPRQSLVGGGGIRTANRTSVTGEIFAEGGPVTRTGFGHVEAGEFVLTKTVLSGITAGFHAMIAAVQKVTDHFTKLGSTVGNVAAKTTGIVPELLPADQASKEKRGGLTGALSGVLNAFKGGKDDKDKSTKDDQSSSIQAFGDAVATFADGVSGFIKGITGAKSGGEGAVSGGMAGLKLGSETGIPFAGAIGAGIGATIGGITGSKNKALMQDIHKIQTQFQSIVADLQAGTISLSQAITDLRNERKSAIAMLSSNPKGGKGGGKGGKKGYSPTQAQAVIQQIDAQISQLVDQQTNILKKLHSSLMEVSQPVQFQEYIQSLDTIIQKYQEFASAAQGNAQEVAVANQYLNQSLQNYVQTLSHDLNAAQQTAINDALTLINLEYQRQQLINQEAQQEYDILTQGVLVRQRTTAMTKGQEIGQLRYQRDMQLQQMNEQIALAQHKVDAETKIFGLAKDRIGLETQLLAAQTEQADFQIAQVQALASVLAALQSGLTGGSLMAKIEALMASGAVPTESGLLFALLQELGLGGNVPPGATQGPYGTKNWLASIPSTDASAAQYVASQDSNFPYMIAAGQYSAAAADAQQYVKQGEVEGFNMTGLVAWLQSQANIPSHEAGGPIPTTGPYIGHAGEYVLSNPMVKALNSLVNIGGGSNARIGQTDTLSLQTHKALYDLTSHRTDMEMQVISARHSQLSMEMDHLQMLQDTLDSINQAGARNGGQTSFEGLLAKVYEVRGRYGSANFRRETL